MPRKICINTIFSYPGVKLLTSLLNLAEKGPEVNGLGNPKLSDTRTVHSIIT